MNRIRMIFSLFVGLTALAMPISACAEDGPQEAYNAYGCYQCHGFSGQGGAAGPKLAPEPLPFDAFAEFVRRPPNRMPAYSPAVLSDDELALIYDYVKGIEAPPALDDIPLLSNGDR